MEVHIEEIVSHITAVDDQLRISQEDLARIVRAVLEAVREERRREDKVRSEHSSLGNMNPRGGRL